MKSLFDFLSRVRSVFRRPVSGAVLSELLESSLTPKTLAERILWAELMLEWLTKDANHESTRGRYLRLKFLLHQFDRQPAWRDGAIEQITLLLCESPILSLFIETGYANEQGLLHESARRLLFKILPSEPDHTLLALVREVFTTNADVQWFEEMPKETSDLILSEFRGGPAERIQTSLRTSAFEALAVVSTQLAARGLSSSFRFRSKNDLPTASPFYRLTAAVHGLALTNQRDIVHSREFSDSLKQCRRDIETIYRDMEFSGTSVGLVYHLEVMTAAVDRIEQLAKVVSGELKSPEQQYQFVAQLFKAAVESRWIIGHVVSHMHLISRKIAERNGASGEHYIARSETERRSLFVSALWGGVIVLLMTLVKTMVLSVGMAPLVRAVLVWLVYSGGFLVMQFTHSTLATKLPSFTASQLAHRLKNIQSSDEITGLAKEFKTVFSSQALAFGGNLVSLIPLAILLDVIFFSLFGDHVVSSVHAGETLSSLHPFFSMAIPLGALTGVLLWISSLAGGWFENWVVYRNLPQAIEHHRRVIRVFGTTKARVLGESIRQNASGVAANVALGFLFGFVPFLGQIVGLPLESKHVTISSAGGVMSLMSLANTEGIVSLIATTTLGLVLIGIMNLGVSFAFALIVAARATALDSRRFRMLLKMTARALVARK